MLNITICDQDDEYLNLNVTIVNKVLVENDIDYRIHKFSGFNEKFNEVIHDENAFKIYILDASLENRFGVHSALKIREHDLDSIIIFTSDCDEKCNDIIHNKLLAFDYICKDTFYKDKVTLAIKDAIDVYFKHRIFTFSYNHVVYRIPYSDINYIEKEPLIKRCIIHAVDNNYYIVNSMEHLLEILGRDFVRTHQSCIVNVNNIRKINLVNNEIIFKNKDKTHLLTDKMKKEIKEYVKPI